MIANRLQAPSMTTGCLTELRTPGLKWFKLTLWLCHREAMSAVHHNLGIKICVNLEAGAAAEFLKGPSELSGCRRVESAHSLKNCS